MVLLPMLLLVSRTPTLHVTPVEPRSTACQFMRPALKLQSFAKVHALFAVVVAITEMFMSYGFRSQSCQEVSILSFFTLKQNT